MYKRQEEVFAYLSTRVVKWLLPDEILFVDSLPHTATGKLLKTALREQSVSYTHLDVYKRQVPNSAVLGTCLCMGSVSFEVRAGEIVDMGTICLLYTSRCV